MRLFVVVDLSLLFFLISAQIFTRFFRIPVVIHDEIVVLCTVWFAFIGSAILVRDNDHIWIDLIHGLLKKKPRLWHAWQVLINLVVVVFLIMMLVSALAFVELGNIVNSPMLFLPLKWWYLSMAVSAVLMIFYTVTRIAGEIRKTFSTAGDVKRESES